MSRILNISKTSHIFSSLVEGWLLICMKRKHSQHVKNAASRRPVRKVRGDSICRCISYQPNQVYWARRAAPAARRLRHTARTPSRYSRFCNCLLFFGGLFLRKNIERPWTLSFVGSPREIKRFSRTNFTWLVMKFVMRKTRAASTMSSISSLTCEPAGSTFSSATCRRWVNYLFSKWKFCFYSWIIHMFNFFTVFLNYNRIF